jgi:hypothetical protein
MTEQDNIKDLFAKGLQDHQVPVDPAIWSAVSASIGATAAPVGLSVLSKVLIGLGTSAGLIVGAYFYTTSGEPRAVSNKNPLVISSNKQGNLLKEETTAAKSKNLNSVQDEHPIQTETSSQTFAQPEATPLTNAIPVIGYPLAEQIQLAPQTQPTPASNNTTSVNQTSTGHANNVGAATIGSAVVSTQATAAPAQNPRITPLTNTPKIKLPNVFTPNNDGQNDWLEIDWKGLAVSDFSLVVLNQNNQVVYRSSDPNFNWSGTDLGGEKLAPGFFIYFVTGQINGEKWQQSSSLQIQY